MPPSRKPLLPPPRAANGAPARAVSAEQYLRHQRFRALVWRLRPLFYLSAVTILVGVCLSVLAPTPAVMSAAVVLVSPASAGQQIAASQVTESMSAAKLSPDTLSSIDAATGRRLLVDLPAGAVLTDSLLSRPDSRQIIPDGKVAASVPAPPGDLLMMLEPGDLVDLVAAGEDGTQVLAERAQILPGSALGGRSGRAQGGGLLNSGSSGGDESVSLLVAVTSAESRAIAGLGVWADIRVILVE